MFEWDDLKAAANLAKHGIDFEDAAGALLGLTVTRESKRRGEVRFASLAEIDGRVVAIAWTPRAGALRLISARHANRHEREAYYQAIRERAQPR